MTRPKDIGTAGESLVVRHLRTYGVEAHRVALGGSKDVGDVHALDGRVVIEVKTYKHWASAGQIRDWMRDTYAETLNSDHGQVGVLVVKRPGSGEARAGDWLCYMVYTEFIRLFTFQLAKFNPAFPGLDGDWDPVVSFSLTDLGKILAVTA